MAVTWLRWRPDQIWVRTRGRLEGKLVGETVVITEISGKAEHRTSPFYRLAVESNPGAAIKSRLTK